MKRLLYLLILLNTSLYAQYTNTIYLDPGNSGDPSQDGSIDHPYDHINDVSISSNTMYLFKRGTSMIPTSEIVIATKDYVYLGAYDTGERPKIVSSAYRNIKIENSANITVDGLEVTSPTYTGGSCIFIQSWSSGSKTVENILINDCELSYKGSGVAWLNYGNDIDGITISNSEIHHIAQDGVFGKETTNVVFDNVHIHHINMNWDLVGHTQVQAGGDGIQTVGCRPVTIKNCTIDRRNSGNKFCVLFSAEPYHDDMRVYMTGNTFYPPKDTAEAEGGTAIGIHPYTKLCVFERNVISGRGYDAASSSQGIWNQGGDTTYFNYNIIDSIHSSDGPGAIKANNLIHCYNNTVVNPVSQSSVLIFESAEYAYIRNNLVAANTTFAPISTFGVDNLTMDHNIIHNSSDPSTYNSAIGIVDWEASDFHRTSNINDGLEVGLQYDIDSVYVGNPPERGVCEYIEGGQSNNPPNINNQTFGIEENTANGTQVATILATDPDQGQVLTYSILSGNTSNAFQLNANTGELTVNNQTALDYETTPEFNLTIKVQDNGIGSLSDQAVVTIELINIAESPIADFSSDSVIVTAGNVISFQDESLNIPTNWIWQFEGGTPNTSFENNPMITYNSPGIYKVGLVVSNSIGYDMLIKTAYIEVQASSDPPIANFTSNTTLVSAGDNIYFQDESLNLPTSWLWEFEGGTPNISYVENPIISYNIPGVYNVKLIVSNSNGYDMLIKTDYIEVQTSNNIPIAGFTANSTTINVGEIIYFQDESLNLPTNWIWQFEGGTPSTSFNKNPVVAYNSPGTYNVNLVVSNSNGYDMLIQTDFIEVQTNTNPPIAEFTSNYNNIIAGEVISFQDESLNYPTNWIWQFEGGTPNTSFDENPIVTYNNPGIYNVNLVASNSYGYDMLIKSDFIEVDINNNPPITNFSANATTVIAGNGIYFQDESTNLPTNWIWQFEGGSPGVSFSKNPVIAYTTPGVYNVQLLSSNVNGYDILLKSDYIEVLPNNSPPSANFSANNTFVTAGESINFMDESLNLPSMWKWEFEGGTPFTSYEKNPTITYNSPGIYDVKLYVSNANGNDIIIKSDYITVQTNNKPPIANLSANTTVVTAGENIYFQDESLNFPTNWIWQFEGGTPNTSFKENPVITYNTPGIFNVQLVASNSNGYDIILKTDYIEVQVNNNPPIANFSANTLFVFEGESIHFKDESLNLPTNWIWQFEGGTPNTSFNKNPIITYNTSGIYNVQLVASNPNGYDILLKTDYIEVYQEKKGEAIIDTVIKSDEEKYYINLYPNPTYDNVTITLPKTSNEKYKIRIYSLFGEIAKEIEFFAVPGYLTKKIDLSNLRNGTYILHLEGGDIIERHKFIKL